MPPTLEDLERELADLRRKVTDLERSDLLGPDVASDAAAAGLLGTLLENVPDYVYFKDAERRFVCVSRSFERLFHRAAADIVGLRDEDVFPPEIATETAADDRLVIEHAETFVNKLEGGEVEGGRQHWVLSTKLPWRDAAGRVRGLFGISREITEIKLLQDALAHSERRYRGVVEAQSDFIVRWRPDGTRTFVNRAYCEYFGVSPDEALGTSVWHAVPRKDRDIVSKHIASLTSERPAISGEHRVTRRDGRSAWYQWSLLGFFDSAGRLVELQAVGRDVSERKEGEVRQALLASELDHRVKNALATVLSLADETLEHSRSLGEFQAAFRGRLGAMSQAHEVLARGRWTAAEISDVVRVVVGPAASGAQRRIDASGEPARLAARSVQAFALVLNELVTNARKHGALSVPDGHVELRWARASDGRLHLTWRETGGPQVSAPGSHGLGLALVRELVDRELGGSWEDSFEASGFRCTLALPLALGMQGTYEAAARPGAATPPGAAAKVPLGLRILLVEDDVLQARLLLRVLSRQGCDVVGPAPSVADALQLVATGGFDVAILDVDLRGETSARVAEALARRGIPFVVMSGYGGSGAREPAYEGHPRLAKPVDPVALLAALGKFVRR
jgi:PAS domain S-box-containing protein